jgi:ribosomal protein S18 acetylase RimI-like enzyme
VSSGPAERPCVERIGPDEWQEWRQLRLEALREAPRAFCSRYADVVTWNERRWRERLTAPGGCWLARGERPLAMAAAWPEGDRYWFGSVYVTPAGRGRGLLDGLLGAAAGWGREAGARALHLEVHEENGAAVAAYRRLGFTETGGRRPYPLDPTGDELEMVLSLPPAPGPHQPADRS